MKSIYASKLFIASKRKEQIKAALLSTANEGLVQQLAEDLDEEYKTPENLGQESESKEKSSENAEENEFSEFAVDEEIDPEKDLVTMDDVDKSSKPSKRGLSSSKPSDSHNSAPEPPEGKRDIEGPKADTSELMPESPANENPAPEPEASTQIEEKESIKASSVIDKLNTFKDTLNSREDTAGVTRIAQKDKECWIYYNDDVNLNDIMVSVIECIANIDCDLFEFNRLARSDNAIVFVTAIATTEEPKSIDPEEIAKEK